MQQTAARHSFRMWVFGSCCVCVKQCQICSAVSYKGGTENGLESCEWPSTPSKVTVWKFIRPFRHHAEVTEFVDTFLLLDALMGMVRSQREFLELQLLVLEVYCIVSIKNSWSDSVWCACIQGKRLPSCNFLPSPVTLFLTVCRWLIFLYFSSMPTMIPLHPSHATSSLGRFLVSTVSQYVALVPVLSLIPHLTLSICFSTYPIRSGWWAILVLDILLKCKGGD